MSRIYLSDDLSVDAVEYASRANAILGIRDSGKTFTATLIAEQLFDASIPFFAFDPIGRWRFLQVPNVFGGKGFPVVVAGGADPDLPLTPDDAPRLVRAAMKAGVSMVIDLYSVGLSKSDWRKIVRGSIETILYENEGCGQRHVFLEEAAEFVPQKIYDGQTYAAIEKLARMGGNVGCGLTLINQRAEEVNKAVLELCDNLLLHRQRGKNSLLSLRKWLDAGAVKSSKEIASSLAELPTGRCWAWMREIPAPRLIRIAQKRSFDPNRREMASKALPVGKRADVSGFIEAMRASLEGKKAKVTKKEDGDVKESEARALREENDRLKERVAELERDQGTRAATVAQVAQGGVSVDDVVAEVLRRARTDDAILAVIARRPEIQVKVHRPVIEVDDSSLRGQVAILISENFFDGTATGNSAFNELKRRGRSVAKPSVYRECDKLAEMGFLTKEGDGYRAVQGMKVNIVEV